MGLSHKDCPPPPPLLDPPLGQMWCPGWDRAGVALWPPPLLSEAHNPWLPEGLVCVSVLGFSTASLRAQATSARALDRGPLKHPAVARASGALVGGGLCGPLGLWDGRAAGGRPRPLSRLPGGEVGRSRWRPLWR